MKVNRIFLPVLTFGLLTYAMVVTGGGFGFNSAPKVKSYRHLASMAVEDHCCSDRVKSNSNVNTNNNTVIVKPVIKYVTKVKYITKIKYKTKVKYVTKYVPVYKVKTKTIVKVETKVRVERDSNIVFGHVGFANKYGLGRGSKSCSSSSSSSSDSDDDSDSDSDSSSSSTTTTNDCNTISSLLKSREVVLGIQYVRHFKGGVYGSIQGFSNGTVAVGIGFGF